MALTSKSMLSALKIVLGIAIISLIFYFVDFNKISKAFDYFGFYEIAILLILTVIRNFAGALRFSVLTKSNKAMTIQEVLRQYFIGSFYNTFLPGNLGGDVVRVLMMNRLNYSKTEAGLLIGIERYFGLIALLVISLTGMLFFDVQDDILNIVMPALLVLAVVFLLVMFLLSQKYKHFKILKQLSEIFELAIHQKSTSLLLLFLSIVFQLIAIFISFYIASVINVSISFVACMSIIPIIWLITLLPITFGGNGIRELGFVYLFGKINISPENSLIISLGTYLTLIMSGVIGLFLHMRAKNILTKPPKDLN
jgi:uncharacterized membrane protein YbhN (UPF0104 family)